MQSLDIDYQPAKNHLLKLMVCHFKPQTHVAEGTSLHNVTSDQTTLPH